MSQNRVTSSSVTALKPASGFNPIFRPRGRLALTSREPRVQPGTCFILSSVQNRERKLALNWIHSPALEASFVPGVV